MEFLETKLANGLEIVGEYHPQGFSASVGFLIRTGARDELPEETGISHLIEHLLFKGTTTRSVDDVNRFFDDCGADYNAWTDVESTICYATVPPESLIPVTRLWAELMRPAFREEDIEPERQVVLEEIRMYDDMPPFGMDEKSRSLFFGAHPLGNSVAGSLESVSAITPEMIRRYHRTHYSPDRMILAVAGKFDFDDVVRTAQELCGDMEPSGVSQRYRDVTTTTGRYDYYRDSAQQSYTIQIADGPGAMEDDLFAARIIAILVGDECGSRLFRELADPGLAESISMTYSDYMDAGCYTTWMSCSPEDQEPNLERIRHVYETLERNGVTEDEMIRSRNKLATQIVLAGERSCGRLFAIGDAQLRGRMYTSVRDELDQVRSVTRDAVHEVLAKRPLGKNLTVTIGPHEPV